MGTRYRRPYAWSGGLIACAILAALILQGIAHPAKAKDLPRGFSHLSAVAPSIAQSIRYAGSNNFVGKPLPGYQGNSCVLAAPVAKALSRVQQRAQAQGLTLLVFDCYRPARAVAAMMRSVQTPNGTDRRYHPDISASDLVRLGYVAQRSGHSSGGSVDLTLGRWSGNTLSELDMGTPFDLFGLASHTRAPGTEAAILANRELLVGLMQAEGFANYRKEWWHFRYRNEPYRGRVFDFIIPKPQ